MLIATNGMRQCFGEIERLHSVAMQIRSIDMCLWNYASNAYLIFNMHFSISSMHINLACSFDEAQFNVDLRVEH